MKFDKEQLRALAIMNNQTLDTLEFEMLNEMEDMLDEENKEKKLLQQRIDKAIEYILNHELVDEKDIINCNKKELLNILKGEE